MIAEEEWNRAFLNALPVASLGIGVFSVALGIFSLQRSAVGRRAHHEDGRYLVAVRYPGQWNEIRDFVQPSNPDVLALYSEIGPDSWRLYDWVCQNIDYARDIGEWWETPSETLARGQADCEGTSILLCSLLRNFTDAHVALGSYQDYGHAWCELNGQILETTYTSARLVPDPQDYQPYVYFSDRDLIELWPGALGEVFEIGRDEQVKLALLQESLIAQVLGAGHA